jgi:CDP-2,3-bis-(O-geranylgeranyl)-sn-glycerol synthase
MQGFDTVVLFLLLVIPAYVANAVPVVLGGGKTFDGLFKKKFFGKNKTIRGFVSGIVFGTLAAFAVAMALPASMVYPYILFGFLSSLGTMAGDLLGSLIKRRSNVAEGKPFFLDQVLFIIMALAFGYAILGSYYTIGLMAAILILTYVFHALFNVIANRLGIKNVPW